MHITTGLMSIFGENAVNVCKITAQIKLTEIFAVWQYFT
ncbi:hypothetical protein PULV_a2701 [Pseudoalteromonas ulvae UL12]|nr:hypothetical protein [Pseudoalteromonas ulvae UL12]